MEIIKSESWKNLDQFNYAFYSSIWCRQHIAEGDKHDILETERTVTGDVCLPHHNNYCED